MKLSKYRIQAGHYNINGYTILWGGRNFWQVRDGWDNMIQYFPTLRQALRYAATLNALHQ